MTPDDSANVCGSFSADVNTVQQAFCKLSFQVRGYRLLFPHQGAVLELVKHLNYGEWKDRGMPCSPSKLASCSKQLHEVFYRNPSGGLDAAAHCEPDENSDFGGHIYMVSKKQHRNWGDDQLPSDARAREFGYYADYDVGTKMFFELCRKSGLSFQCRLPRSRTGPQIK